MLSFVYCLDENYNKQSICSLYSLLENIDEEIKIYLIHKNPQSINNLPDLVTEHRNLSKIKIIEKKLRPVYYPKLTDAHVSEATYYRLNLQNYFLDEEEILIYLDSDVIFINNPTPLFKEQIDLLKNSKCVIAAKTEPSLSKHGEFVLGLSSKKYFNAGVMIIDFKKWKNLNISDKLYEDLEELDEKIVYWDQDVLNHHFDGQYLELDERLNHQVRMDEKKFKKSNIQSMILLHYSGKFKPWTVMGASKKEAAYFHDIYRIIFNEKYLISYNYKLNALKDFLKIFFSFKIFNMKYSFSFIFIVFKSFFK
jgi:lipopolysaccharide biosynthesis glycosyltransferase